MPGLVALVGVLWTSFLLSRSAFRRLSDWVRFYGPRRDWPALLCTPLLVLGELAVFFMGVAFWPITCLVLAARGHDRKQREREREEASYRKLLGDIRADSATRPITREHG